MCVVSVHLLRISGFSNPSFAWRHDVCVCAFVRIWKPCWHAMAHKRGGPIRMLLAHERRSAAQRRVHMLSKQGF